MIKPTLTTAKLRTVCRKHVPGKSMVILFAGPGGTGKTIAAESIANDLSLDLYRVDLSAVVSKYIGETEKNLDRVFAAIEGSNVVLYLDQADALFGKRSEVRDGHDRYANTETGLLLQRIENHKGLVILATNMRNSIDDAFMRRIHYIVEFRAPA